MDCFPCSCGCLFTVGSEGFPWDVVRVDEVLQVAGSESELGCDFGTGVYSVCCVGSDAFDSEVGVGDEILVGEC